MDANGLLIDGPASVHTEMFYVTIATALSLSCYLMMVELSHCQLAVV